MTCSKCGQEVAEGTRFCASCGQEVAPAAVSEQPVAQPAAFTPSGSTPPEQQWQVAPISPSGNGIQEKEHIYANKTAIIVTSIIVGLLLIVGGGYLVYQVNLKKADLAVEQAANELGKDFGSSSPNTGTGTNSGTKTPAKITNTWEAYQFAKTKVSYKNVGISQIKTIYNSKVSKGSFDFTFMDMDSKFLKNDYYYYKATRVQVLEDKTMNSETTDVLLTDDKYAYGSLVLTESGLASVLAKAKTIVSDKYTSLGETYAIFYNDGVSDLSPATWDVYFSKSGQDEKTAGYREYQASVVRLTAGDLSEERSGDSTISYEITE